MSDKGLRGINVRSITYTEHEEVIPCIGDIIEFTEYYDVAGSVNSYGIIQEKKVIVESVNKESVGKLLYNVKPLKDTGAYASMDVKHDAIVRVFKNKEFK